MSFKGVETENLNDIAVPVGLGLTYDHPDELLEDHGVDRDAKRALLAAWASDRQAIEGVPTLREFESGAIVNLAYILRALKQLDRPTIVQSPPKPTRPAFRFQTRPAPIAVPKRPDNDPPLRPVRVKLGGSLEGAW